MGTLSPLNDDFDDLIYTKDQNGLTLLHRLPRSVYNWMNGMLFDSVPVASDL